MVDLEKRGAAEANSSRSGSKVLLVLTWWTFAGTVVSLTDIWTDLGRSGFLWPTLIHPHWLGTLVGAVVLLILKGAYQASVPKKATAGVEPDLTAARARVAAVLRARAAQQSDQRPE